MWKTLTIVVIFIVVIAGGYLVWQKTKARPNNSPAISSIAVARPNLVILGKSLSRVEVWAVPTGTGIHEGDYQHLGDAEKSATASDGRETWRFTIPLEPVLATSIFAKGFDASGFLVGQVSLAQNGATELFDALWASENPPESKLAITWVDSGGTFIFALSSRFSVELDETRYPKNKLACVPAGPLASVADAPAIAPPLFSASFDTAKAGECALRDGDFSINIRALADTSGTATSSNTAYGFTLIYPRADAFQPHRVTGSLVMGSPITRIDLSRNAYVGTNLSEASVMVGASKSPADVSSCLAVRPNERARGTTMINGIAFNVFEGRDAGAGNRYDTKSYRTVHNATCFEVQDFVHYGAIGNYDPGVVQSFNEALVFEKLDGIAGTFVFTR